MPGKATDHALAGLRILLVEDTQIVATEILRILTRCHCDPIGPCPTLDAALDAAHSEPELAGALLDINLEGQEVFPAAEILAARGIPFIFLTGYACTSLEPPFADRPCLEKPFTAAELESAMLREFRAHANSHHGTR